MVSTDKPITLYDFETRQTTNIPLRTGDGILNGHGGGDEGIVNSIYAYFNGDESNISISSIRTSVDNHLLAFAAEESRHNESVIDFEKYVNTLR